MILKTLILQNFRKYKHASIEFPEGIIGVIGLNGSGKSTIFEAVAWALFGSVAARTSVEDIKRNAAEPSAICLVDLCFEFEGDQYRVVRQMKGKNQVSSATITKNDKIIATGAGTSAAYIQKLLGMDYKSFFTSIFAKQKELNTLSSMNASERRPLILKMLGIDALDDVIKQINADKRSKITVVSHLEKNLVDRNGKNKEHMLFEKEKTLKSEFHKISTELRGMKKDLQKFKTDQKTLQKDLKNEKKTYEEINKEYEKLIKQKTVFENYQKLKHEHEQITKKIKTREQTINDLEKRKTDSNIIKKEISSLDKKKETLRHQTTEIIQNITKKQTNLDQIKTQKKELYDKQKTMDNLGADTPCPTCERELGSQFDFLQNKYKKKHEELTKHVNTIEKDVQLLKEKQDQIKKQQIALEKKKKYLEKTLSDQRGLQIKIEGQIQEKKREEKDLQNLSKQIKKIPSTEFNKESFQSVQRKQKTTYKSYQNLIKKVNKAKDLLNQKILDIEKKQGYLTLLKQQITSVKKQRSDHKEMLETISIEQQNITELSLLRDIMSSFRLHLITRIRPALSQYASEFFHDLTDGKYPEMDLDDQYNIYIYDDGEKYPIQRFSGGEIDLANLCLRLAISDVITERAEGLFHFIILDEIFGSQDRLRQQNIMQELYNLSSTFKQIFLITHVEDVKHFMQHILQVEEIDDISKVTMN